MEILPLISNPFSPHSKPLGTIPSAPAIIGTTDIFTNPSFYSSLAKSKYWSLFSLTFIFTQWSAGTTKSISWPVLWHYFFSFINFRSDFLFVIWRSVSTSKSLRILWVIFSRTDSGFCVYHLVISSNFNFLHSSQWITFPNQSCLVSQSYCASLLHLLAMQLIVSFPSQHNLPLLFSFVLI